MKNRWGAMVGRNSLILCNRMKNNHKMDGYKLEHGLPA